MKIKVSDLRALIKDELSKSEKEKRRKKRLFGYASEEHIEDEHLKALGRGIIKLEDCPGNAGHKKSDGTFAAVDDDGSYSLSGKDCKKRKTGQYKMTKGKAGPSRSPCGRKNRKKLCSEDKQKDLYYREALENLIRTTIKQEIAKATRANNCTTNDILNWIDKFEDASRGKLGDKSKK